MLSKNTHIICWTVHIFIKKILKYVSYYYLLVKINEILYILCRYMLYYVKYGIYKGEINAAQY